MNLKTLLLASAVCAVMISSSSCSTNRTSLTYFEDTATVTDTSFPMGEYNIKIQPDEEHFSSVSSLVPEATAMYNLPVMNPGLRSNIGTTTTPQSQTYVVDPKGDIIFPVLGKLHVAGYTVEGLADEITKMVSKDVSDPIVRVELMNFKVNVLGEVRSPGAKHCNTRRVTILDALSMAGDMTSYGRRDNIAVIREVDGKRELHRLDLNKSDVFTSPYFYLQQIDIVYVEPNKIIQDNSKYNQNNAYKLSVTSTVVSAASVIASLVIALTVK